MANAQSKEISFQKLMEEVARDYLFFKFSKARFARAHGIDPLELYHMGLRDGANAGYVEGFRDGALSEHDRKSKEEQKRKEEGVEGEAPALVDITASSKAQNNRRVYDATLLLLIRYGGVLDYRERFERARSFEDDDDEFYGRLTPRPDIARKQEHEQAESTWNRQSPEPLGSNSDQLAQNIIPQTNRQYQPSQVQHRPAGTRKAI
ncbi:hypothetical protein GGR55DRAFT_703222 [Xylaria sp. FL0064]|nr:hypothetical protein GGR55DRAFT_703222 [Xylaria sp. FL0064]